MGVHVVGGKHLGKAAASELNLPPARRRPVARRLEDAVVVPAEQHQVGQSGGAARAPGDDVVRLAQPRRRVAAGEGAALRALPPVRGRRG